MSYLTDQDDIQFFEPILPQKGVKLKVNFVESTEWEVKAKPSWSSTQNSNMAEHVGKKFDALKMTLDIDDQSVKTEHADARPRLTLEHQFNIERYPYPDKNTGSVKWMGRQNLYQVEEAFGFDPVFLDKGGSKVPPFITKTGNKVAPKIDGVKRVLNPDFANAYLDADGKPYVGNWVGKTIYANVEVERSEKYGAKNIIQAFVKAPII